MCASVQGLDSFLLFYFDNMKTEVVIQFFANSIIDAQQSVAACSVFSEENTTIFVVLGIMTVVCVLLIAVIIVLMCVNRRNVTLNNHLNGNLQEQNLSLNLDEVKRVK